MSSINQEFLPLYRIQSFGKICRYSPYFLIKDYTCRSIWRNSMHQTLRHFSRIFTEIFQESSKNISRIFFFLFFSFSVFFRNRFLSFCFCHGFLVFYLFFVFSGISQFPFFVFSGIVFIFFGFSRIWTNFRCVPEVNLFYFFFRVLKLKVFMLFRSRRKVYALFLRNINIVLSSDLNALKIVDYSRD